jgi:membrane protein
MTAAIGSPMSAILKRISTLLLLVCSIAIAINLYIMHSENARQWYEIESEQLGRSLTIQAARLLSQPLSQEDNELTQQYIALLNDGMFIEGAVVFDNLGVRISSINNAPSVVDMISQGNYAPLVFVEDIQHDGQTLGYIKLILNRDEIIRHHEQFNRSQFTQTLLVIVLAMLIAALATRLFYKVNRNYDIDPDESKLL